MKLYAAADKEQAIRVAKTPIFLNRFIVLFIILYNLDDTLKPPVNPSVISTLTITSGMS